jgi:hypothetical protein
MGELVIYYEDDNEQEVKVDIEYSYYGGYRGARDSFNGRAGAGAQLEPDEPEQIEIESMSFLSLLNWPPGTT